MHTKDLPTALATRLHGHDLIVFDGTCVFCSYFFRFIVKHDWQKRFHFATAQSPLGQSLYKAMGLPTDDFETNLIITNGQIHQRLDAFAAAMRALGRPYAALSVLRYLPKPIKDPAYHLIARNRYRLFGRTDTCLVPDAAVKARFLA